jgi:hypothetical protein
MARSPQQILQNDYLVARAKIIEVAAVLDRIDRAVMRSENAYPESSLTVPQPGAPSGSDPVYSDPSYQKIQRAIAILSDGMPDKARRIQELLSRPYAPNWMQQFQLPVD